MVHRSNSVAVRAGILEAVRRILAPLARAGAQEGLSKRALLAAAKEALVPATGREKTVGVRVDFSLALRLTGRWISERPYAVAGRPRVLPLHGSGSFDELARQVGVDPAITLATLREVGAVRAVRGQRVALNERGYLPTLGLAEKLDILGRDAAEFAETILHNLHAVPGNTRLQRKASYDNIGERALRNLRRRLKALAKKTLEVANRELASVDRDRNPGAPRGRRTRVSFGIYLAEAGVPVSGTTRGTRKRSKRSRSGNRR
jgi:hypothetical protein